jgi:hypothetical protein
MLRKTIDAQRSALLALSIMTTLLMSACSPDAPPCNDPETTQSVLTMVGQAHDDRLHGLPYASKDLATFELDAVAPTAYDDKLKLRSCKAVFVMTLLPDKANAADKFVKVMSGPLMNLTQGLRGLMDLAGGSEVEALKDMQRDAVKLQMLNPGTIRADPIRKSLTYRIQKEEGSKSFIVSTNVDITQTVPYLRVASRAQKMIEEARTNDIQHNAEKVQKDVGVATSNPSQTAPTSGTSSGPENLESLITHYEQCGDEAVCLHSAKGNTIYVQASQMRHMDFAMLDAAIKARSTVCLREVVRNEGKNFTAESLDSKC